MKKECRIKTVARTGGILVDDETAWYNPTREYRGMMPPSQRLIGKKVVLHLVDGMNHVFNNITLLDSTSAEEGRPDSVTPKPMSSPSREERITRMDCLNSAIHLAEITGLLRGKTISTAKKKCISLAEELEAWVMEAGK